MKTLLLLLLVCAEAFGQSSQFGATQRFGATQTLNITIANPASNLMGVNEFNQNVAGSASVLQGTQFVYSQFTQQAALPNPASDSCSAISGGLVYVIGGYGANATTFLTYVQIYNPTTNSWSQGATLTTGIWGSACAAYNGNIYLFGGNTSTSGSSGTTTALAYNITGNSWSTLTAFPVAIADGGMAVTVGTNIYIDYGPDLYQFNPGSDTYTALTTPPSAAQVRWAATGYVNVSGDDRIYFIGGCPTGSCGSLFLNTNYYYSVTNASWSGAQATAPYTAYGMLQNSTYNGNIYFIAGHDINTFYRSVFSYTPATNTWSSALSAMNGFRDGVSGGFIGSTLYVVGGRSSTTSPFGLAANESYQIGSSPTSQVFTKIQLNYASAAGNVRLGIYADAGSSGPGALILDAGSVGISTGWTVISGLSLALTPGTYYWLALLQDNSTATISYTGAVSNNPNGFSGGADCYVSQAYGPLPSTFPAGCTSDATITFAEKITVN